MKLTAFVTTILMLMPVMSLTAQAAEQKAHALTAILNLTSNYIWRGVIQTQDQVAVQGLIK